MSTYLELTNLLLRRLLESELTSSEFPSARSTQATAKDCIKHAVDEIYTRSKAWPFFYESGTQLLVVGQEEYTLPADCEVPSWDSFRIEADTGNQTTPLKPISRDEWYRYYRPQDEDSDTDGRRMPQYVFNSNYNGTASFGVSPSPDAAYTVNYEYYKFVESLDLYSDEVLIPERYNYVIINCALKYFYSFKDNLEQTSMWENRAEKSISDMKFNLLDDQGDMRDTRINFGGSTHRYTFDM